MPSNCCAFAVSSALLLISITLTQFCQTLSNTSTACLQSHCDRSQCQTTPDHCPHGFVDDECQCCKVCVKSIGETCGPAIGQCAKGLKCLSSQHLDQVLTNSVISDKQSGVCGVLNCTGVKCHNQANNDNIKCHNDSYKLLSVGDDSCCQTTCVCLPGICNTSVTRCPHSQIARVVAKGDGKPGSCCDLIQCIDAPMVTCNYNNRRYTNGEKWQSDKCTTCECRDGLTFCQKKMCKAIPNCMAVINDECCPTCQGCISSEGNFYNNTQNWYENDCMHCECIDGEVRCNTQMCGPLSCDHQITVEGQCCPVCANTSFDCDIHCPMGYKLDSSGKELCQCNHCPNEDFACHLSCPSGYKKGSDGCPTCQCNTETESFQRPNPVIKDDIHCNASNGSLIASGLYWNDGCRECFCNSGKVMCTKPDCPPTNCPNPKLADDKCCHVCSDDHNKDSSSSAPHGSVDHLHSHLFVTAIILTLIIAILLLGIFLLLAIFILKKYPNLKYQRNRVINRTVKDHSIIHLWPYSRPSAPVPKAQENQFIGIRVTNDNNLLNEELGHSLQEKLLPTSTCAN